MAITTLFSAGAFGPGSELWITPSLKASPWTKTLDWYLNLQVLRSRSHKERSIPEALREILQKSGLPQHQPDKVSDKPLLVASHKVFPNREIVVLPDSIDKNQWLEQAHTVWSCLNKPSIRIFLPENIQENDFRDAWPEGDGSGDISLVPHSAMS